jgi:hypothetical protein
VNAPLLAVPSVITFTSTGPMTCAGIEEMPRVVPLVVKHPAAGTPPTQGVRVAAAAVCSSAAVPIRITVAPAMFVPDTMTAEPCLPAFGVTTMPLGASGSVPGSAPPP